MEEESIPMLVYTRTHVL